MCKSILLNILYKFIYMKETIIKFKRGPRKKKIYCLC